ncbi:Uncharacterised protein [Mycobacteroides abscessus]|uniref:Phosphoadenosine phosphosulfate reductase n=1 Tax=Mycolicibacterium llatzerense TaxID=280871 RepID=A0A0D1IWB2_9MYCO|nr:hypothetical protein TL10_28770 [Mycolicibacterium llatzerense]CPT78094.1 Uncharacterised protein [Mycobacteroides abscessus]SKK65728.1 Uncharacterised protein [Mycobacteroides abscessus subsp. massiliense]MCT7372574.1 hypothetical protein [Mycolicibacterium llatzerense]CPU63239.1 Uncharacterised protein [Mycobacteroides abscessus]
MVASFGLGLDSTSMIVRWMTDPASRDFDLSELAVVSAMTGHESQATISAMSRLIIPMLAAHSVRFIQVARAQRRTTRAGAGVVVLDDSRWPSRLHADGIYTLGDEMLAAATLPQLGGKRLCSVHAKGDALDPVIARITKGHRYRHAVGFEADERSRSDKDRLHDTDLRRGWYPLQDWGWTRRDCAQYLLDVLGEEIPKSCCGFCPFAMSSAAGRDQVITRYRREPNLAADALFLEYVARSINPSQTLIVGSSAADLVADAELTEALALFQSRLDSAEWSLYEVRRVVRPARNGRGITARALEVLATGTRTAMADQLAAQPGRRVVGADGIVRHILRDRSEGDTDHLFVAAPAGPQSKKRSGFEQWWQEATGEGLF